MWLNIATLINNDLFTIIFIFLPLRNYYCPLAYNTERTAGHITAHIRPSYQPHRLNSLLHCAKTSIHLQCQRDTKIKTTVDFLQRLILNKTGSVSRGELMSHKLNGRMEASVTWGTRASIHERLIVNFSLTRNSRFCYIIVSLGFINTDTGIREFTLSQVSYFDDLP